MYFKSDLIRKNLKTIMNEFNFILMIFFSYN